MSAVEIASTGWGTLLRPTGPAGSLVPVVGATCQINILGGGSATIWSDNTRTASLTQPLTTRSDGTLAGFIDLGTYTGTWTIPGQAPFSHQLDMAGPTGATGPPGVGASWQGVWSSGTTYTLNQGVSRNGLPYISNANSNLNHDPATDAVNWTAINPVDGLATVGTMRTLGTGAQQAMAGNDSRVASLAINVKAAPYNAKGDGTTDDAAAIQAAITAAAGGGDVLFPIGTYKVSSTLNLTDGIRLVGMGAQQRWRTSSRGVTLTYTGTGQLVSIANTAGASVESVEIHNMRLDGTGLAGSVHGLYVNGLAGTTAYYTEGVLLRNVAITNFPGNQLRVDGLVIDVTCDYCGFNNSANVSANPLIYNPATGGTGKIFTQCTLNNCFLVQYGNSWSFFGAASDLRVFGGTMTTNGQAGGSGIRNLGHLSLMGTHLEGAGSTGVGIRWLGTSAAMIEPAQLITFGTGVQIGDPGAPTVQCIGAVIGGMVGNNTVDIQVVAGGSRAGTMILTTGNAIGAPIIVDNRASTDGVFEVTDFTASSTRTPKLTLMQQAGTGGTCTLFASLGVPAVGLGVNGDFCLRQDGSAGTCLYQKRAGAWVATGA